MWCMENVDEDSSNSDQEMGTASDNEAADEFNTPPEAQAIDYQVEKTLENLTSDLLENLQQQQRYTDII